jgi:hypothetical protein
MDLIHHGYWANCGRLRLVVIRQHDHVLVRIFDTDQLHIKKTYGNMNDAKYLAIETAATLGVDCAQPKWEPYRDTGI